MEPITEHDGHKPDLDEMERRLVHLAYEMLDFQEPAEAARKRAALDPTTQSDDEITGTITEWMTHVTDAAEDSPDNIVRAVHSVGLQVAFAVVLIQANRINEALEELRLAFIQANEYNLTTIAGRIEEILDS